MKGNLTKQFNLVLKLLFIIFIFLISLTAFITKKNFVNTYKPFVVTSDSMIPTIKKGSLVIVDKNKKQFSKNDIITFQYPINMQKTITHRIVGYVTEANYNYFVTKGDNNSENDPWKVTTDLIIGNVVFTIPLLGYLVEFISKPLGLILLIIIPAIILIYKEVENLIKVIANNLNSQKRKSPNIFMK